MGKTLTPKSEQKKTLVAQGFQFSGPIPHPSILNQYDPETRKILVDMAHQQSQHRQFIERTDIVSNVGNEKAGMIISAIITLSMMISGVFLLVNNKPTVGFLAFFAPALFVGGNYVYQKYEEDKIQKSNQVTSDHPTA